MDTKKRIASLFILLIEGIICLNAQMVYNAPEKKLIDFSQHSPLMTYYKDHIKDYEKGPFDGITLKLSKEVGGGNIFMVDDWAKVPAELKGGRDEACSFVASK